MNISLPPDLVKFANQQVASGKYSSLEAYLGSLIEADQKQKARDHIEQLILEDLDSGPAREMTPDDWADLRRRLRERHAQPNG